jgi:hypothetical protein
MPPAPLLLTDPVPAALPILPDVRPCHTGLLSLCPQECLPFFHHLARTIPPTTIAAFEIPTLKLISQLIHPTQI